MKSTSFADELRRLTQKSIEQSLVEIEKALLDRFGSDGEPNTETAWLVEMVHPEGIAPPTPLWWHPEHGWMWDASKALRFAREQDAVDYINNGTGVSRLRNPFIRGKATEHIFMEPRS